jgi:aminoglycoside phosphotransferase (APT) family kinase protein
MSDTPGDDPVAGIDRARVEQWFSDNVAGAAPPLRFERIAGGRSNITYRVTDERGGQWVLRRPPLSGGLGSAHDMGREHRIVSALAGTDVAVPAALGFCDDESVTGADFYVMDFVDGIVLRDEDVVEEQMPDVASRRRAGESLVDMLARLHAVDPDSVGLGELGRRDGYVERQLKRWKRQWESSKTRELETVDRAHELLSERVPEQQSVAIVHGDYRLDNAIVAPSGDIAAVVDWELCTLGDPLADVGLLAVYWAEPGDAIVPLTRAPTLAPGFPSRRDLIDRYASVTGRDLSQIDFYIALGYWKLAVILEGVYARYAGGAYGDAGDEHKSFVRIVEQLADAAATTAADLRTA